MVRECRSDCIWLFTTTKSILCFGSNHVCHPSFIFLQSSFISILNTLNVQHHHNIVTVKGFLHSLTDSFSCLSLMLPNCDFEFLIIIEQRKSSVSFHGFEFAACHSEILLLMPNSQDSFSRYFFIPSWSIQCVCWMWLPPASTFHLQSRRIRDFQCQKMIWR